MLSSILLEQIIIQNFRNISETKLSFSPGLNLFIGDNGQGKTNCLEAIALSCSLRPMQSLQNAELIKIGHSRSDILAQFADSEVRIEILPKGKKACIDTKPIRSATKLHERGPLVTFIPLELNMISGPASLRRRALDLATCSLFFEHYENLKSYEKILLHRNRLLKSWPLDHQMLSSFSQLLIKEGASIISQRQRAIKLLNPHFLQGILDILGQDFTALLSYSFEAQDKIETKLYEQSEKVKNIEQIRKVTLFGPHLDDIVFFLNSHQAKNYASRGQMRALVLAFKLAQMQAVFNLRGNAPVVILDDIVSELDEIRKANLLQVINNLGIQAFLSANDISAFSGELDIHQVFNIKDGSPHRR